MQDNETLTITMEQLMARTGMKRDKIYRLIRSGELKTLGVQKRNRLFSFAQIKKVLGLED